MQKEIQERSWGTYIKEEDQGRDIVEMPEEKTVTKGTRVCLFWGRAEESSVRLEKGHQKGGAKGGTRDSADSVGSRWGLR